MSSLRIRLLFLVSLAIVPAFALIFYADYEQRREAVGDLQESALRLAYVAAGDQARLVAETGQLLARLAQLSEVKRRDPTACMTVFARLLKRYPLYENLGAADVNGTLFCSAVPVRGSINVADRRYFRRVLATRDFAIGEYEVGEVTSRATINVGYPVVGNDGEMTGVVFAAVDLGWANRLLAKAGLPAGSSVVVVDHKGTVLVRHPDPEKWIGKSALPSGLVKNVLTRRTGVAYATDVDGDLRFYGFTPLVGTPEDAEIYVAIGVPGGSIFSRVNRALARNVATLGFVAAVALAAAWFGGQLLVMRPVHALLDMTRRLAAGDLTARSRLGNGNGELDRLARALDDMAQALLRDRAERERTEAEMLRQREALYQSEKVATMGSLLAGVAHELNNPLTVIMGQTQLLRAEAAPGPQSERAAQVADAGERCARIVRNFLALARQQPPERQPVSLNNVVREAMEMLAYPLKVDNVDVVFDLDPTLPLLWADPHQLHQVVVNIAANAHQAMREVTMRRLAIVTRADPSQGTVRLDVADSGPGMPADVALRIFEPFFTTKPAGQGTGLGLSLCQGIVESHGGSIRVQSEPGEGAVFTVELPVATPPGVEARGTARLLTGIRGKDMLVVDDEPMIANLLAEMLTADGHRVDTAPNGLFALDRLQERHYDVIISDVKMPGLDGPGLWREIEQSKPELLDRFIFITGDELSPETVDFLEASGALNLRKPFALADVRRLTQQILRTAS